LIADLSLSYGVANASLRCIDILPEMTLRWLGTSAIGGSGEEGGLGAAAGGSSASAIANGNGGGGATPAGQQIWQRKLLNVLEQMVTQSGAAAPQHNSGLFAHIADRPDQKPADAAVAASSGVPSVTISAEVAGGTAHVQHTDGREGGIVAATAAEGKNTLNAQVIRGDPKAGDKA
jgi:hypothetical protein